MEKEIFFTKTHEWVQFLSETSAYIGISDFAQDQLGDIVFANIEEGSFSVGDTIGDLESVKAVSDIYTPFSGDVVEINPAILDDPSGINTNPYENWLCRIDNIVDKEELMSEEEYKEFAK